jgi:ATP-binding cassette subfamily C protein
MLSEYRRALTILNKKDHKKLLLTVVLNGFLAILDLIGVGLIGFMGSLLISGVQSKSPGDRVQSLLSFLNLGEQTLQFQIFVLGSAATAILISKTFFSIFITRKTLHYLSHKSAQTTIWLFNSLIKSPYENFSKTNTQESLYLLTAGVNSLVIGVIATSATLAADLLLSTALVIGLFFVNVTLGFTTLILFGIIGLVLFINSNTKAHKLGQSETTLSVMSNLAMLEAFSAFKENFVKNRESYYTEKITLIRNNLSKVLANKAFLPNISKYVIEVTLILGTVVVGGTQFLLSDAQYAVASLSMFLAAGSRIAPSMLRIHQGAVVISASMGAAMSTLDFISTMEKRKGTSQIISTINVPIEFSSADFEPRIELNNVSYLFPDSTFPVISDFSMEVKPYSSVALIGRSGVGKSTIMNLISGLIKPSKGRVTISGLEPDEARQRWPGEISYVPQDVVIFQGSIRHNVSLGFPEGAFDDREIWEALDTARLADFVASLPGGLDHYVGEGGQGISGGQKQRLGIARAVITKPKLLLLDEATSSLDAQTTKDFENTLFSLHNRMTVVLITHKLSSPKNFDQVISLDIESSHVADSMD